MDKKPVEEKPYFYIEALPHAGELKRYTLFVPGNMGQVSRSAILMLIAKTSAIKSFEIYREALLSEIETFQLKSPFLDAADLFVSDRTQSIFVCYKSTIPQNLEDDFVMFTYDWMINEEIKNLVLVIDSKNTLRYPSQIDVPELVRYSSNTYVDFSLEQKLWEYPCIKITDTEEIADLEDSTETKLAMKFYIEAEKESRSEGRRSRSRVRQSDSLRIVSRNRSADCFDRYSYRGNEELKLSSSMDNTGDRLNLKPSYDQYLQDMPSTSRSGWGVPPPSNQDLAHLNVNENNSAKPDGGDFKMLPQIIVPPSNFTITRSDSTSSSNSNSTGSLNEFMSQVQHSNSGRSPPSSDSRSY